MKTASTPPPARRPRLARTFAAGLLAAALAYDPLAAGEPAAPGPLALQTSPASQTPPAAQAPPASPSAPASSSPPASAPAKGKGGSKAPAGKGAKPAKPAPAPPPKPPVPNTALAQLKPLAGSWTCTGRTFGPGPEHATSGAMTFAWQLDGFWLEARSDEQKAATNPVPVSSISQWGFDDLQQSLAANSVDNLGGTAAQTAAGWQGDKLVFEGPARRYSVQFQARDTFVRHGDAQLGHTLEANVNGSWVKLHEDTCQRVPAK